MICRLNKSLYGLKQAPRAWYSWFATFLLTLGFTEAKSDIVLTASSQRLLQSVITSLQQEFAMKDLGQFHHFLGVTVEPRPSGLLLHQRQYALLSFLQLSNEPISPQTFDLGSISSLI